MLSDYFRITLPYGMRRNEDGEWMPFNRENAPIGFIRNERLPDLSELPVYCRYFGLNDQFIMELTGYVESEVERDGKGNICRFWLYNDTTNPMNQPSRENEYWGVYWKKLEALSKLKALSQ